ncbi:dolichyl-phosphate beta-D-mannosyltransferase [Maritalea myrionectae]|uniref:Dolichyl-phosphate beta-D-mannosyltransferase n=1 Tax=Maritalea myrionectae TaxID=454601 RepID=A0A2R4MFD9_9HYPH|nr:glycosyltransferase family 39 protein [Maritalea myrionectae]AVX04761.1 dolichyl-phosphate beta-D-mannosyltransferase [Maritalea myrionectae]
MKFVPDKADYLPSVRALLIIAGLLVLLKLLITYGMFPLGDEAYYWRWAQTPELSYFDHPPLGAWLIALGQLIGLDHLLGLRAVTLLTTLGTLFFIWKIIGHYRSNDATISHTHLFLFVATMLYASPTILVWSSLIYHDHLLIFLASGAFFYLGRYLDRTARGQSDLAGLYAGALYLGLMGLTKYSAVFMGLALVLVILFSSKLRHQLKSPHLYLAGLLTFACMLPLFWWNWTHDWASFGFHLDQRHGAGWLERFNPIALINFVAATLVLFGPFLLVAIINQFRPKYANTAPRYLLRLATYTFVLSTIAFATVSAFAYTLWYWSDLAYLGLLLLIPYLMRSKYMIWGHYIFGIVLVALTTFHYAFAPITVWLPGYDKEASSVYGWSQVADWVNQTAEEVGVDNLAAYRFQTASQLSLVLSRTDVFAIDYRPTQFDYWELPQLSSGKDVLVLKDDISPASQIEQRFETLELIDELPIMRFGQEIYRYELYLGRNFTP